MTEKSGSKNLAWLKPHLICLWKVICLSRTQFSMEFQVVTNRNFHYQMRISRDTRAQNVIFPASASLSDKHKYLTIEGSKQVSKIKANP